MAPSCASATIGASSTPSPRASSSSTAAGCSSYPGNFAAYQERKARQLEDEAVVNAKADKVLAQEEAWIRQGVEARRTRNEGRVLRLEALRRERAARRERLGRVNLQLAAGERSGQLVAELLAVSKDYGDGPLIRDFSTRVIRGDRIGLIGPNGAGKSTLLKLILGEIEPDRGTVRRGVNLHVAYFDQLRAQLDPLATLIDTINPGAEFVEIGGKRTHVITYLGDFLFPPERARSPVASLSGGERNRLLLARLFAQPANVLVLDEPTNDLDIDTLELLEARVAGLCAARCSWSATTARSSTTSSRRRSRSRATACCASMRAASATGPTTTHGGMRSSRRKRSGTRAKRRPPRLPGRRGRTRFASTSTSSANSPHCRQRSSRSKSRPRACATVSPTAPSIAKARRRSRHCRTSLPQREAELAAAYARWEALETRNSASAASGEH